MSIKRIYCDISATTPLDPRIGELLTDLNGHIYGNPSSIHREGQAAKAVVEKSRRQIANAINAQPDEIIFTSSGSESNNMVLKGVLRRSEEHTSELQSRTNLVCRLLLEKKKNEKK